MKFITVLGILVSLIWTCVSFPTDEGKVDSSITTEIPEGLIDTTEIPKTTTSILDVSVIKADSSSEEDTTFSVSSDMISTTPSSSAAAADNPSENVESEPENLVSNPSNQESSESDESDSSSSADDNDSSEDRRKDGAVVFKKKDKFFEKSPSKLIIKSKKYKI